MYSIGPIHRSDLYGMLANQQQQQMFPLFSMQYIKVVEYSCTTLKMETHSQKQLAKSPSSTSFMQIMYILIEDER